MKSNLSWGIVGTGAIAGAFAKAVVESRTGRLVGVGSRSRASADRFGDEHDIPNRYASYEELFRDASVEAVYIATPHPMHAEWTIKAARAGKHILCEKPLTLNHPEAMAVIEAAAANDVFLMEAFMYRCHPQTAKLVELIRQQAIGEVRLIEAALSFQAGLDLESRLFSQELGGGGILDVGCYCTSMARLIAGAAAGKDFEEPIEVKGTAHIGEESRIDEYAIASLRFPGNIIAHLTTGVRVTTDNVVRIYGSEGSILVPQPWFPGTDPADSKLLLFRGGEEEAEEIPVGSDLGVYALQADLVAASIENRQAHPPAMTWDDTLGNMKTLDLWRQSIGLVYDSERPESQLLPVSKRPLAVKPEGRMPYGELIGIEQPVAKIVMGVLGATSTLHAAVLYDDYFERGGNCFDTAYVYGAYYEEPLGNWARNRSVRDQVVIIGKAAHSPFDRPEFLRPELEESLERLQTDYLDVLLAHRDNPDIPVDEWIDGFNELVDAGLIRAFGGSNWELSRIQAGNEYAQRKGRVGFAAVSNNFSLARMVDPVWEGCIASSDPESRAWLESTQFPLLAWSSQARGFFTERAHSDDRSDADLVRSWYSEDNFERQERAKQLAEKRGVPLIAVALAYVLDQPFPCYALIGPETPEQIRTSFQALDVNLTPEERRWLNLED